jgi:hypothetical protein
MTTLKDIRTKYAALSEGFEDDMSGKINTKETQSKGDPQTKPVEKSKTKFEASRPDNDHTGESE